MTLSQNPARMDKTVLPCKDGDYTTPTLLSRATCPALLICHDGTLIYANSAARPLAQALSHRHPVLYGYINAAGCDRTPLTARLVLGRDKANGQVFEIAIWPHGEDRLLILARDTSFEANLTHALLQSRNLYKDIIQCSADFGWETDRNGTITYVTPGGMLGWAPQDITGQNIKTLFALESDERATVFSTRTARQKAVVCAQNRAGEKVVLSVSATPVTGDDGTWQGARGMGRDITKEHEAERTLELDRARQMLLARIVFSVRAEADPRDILTAATLSAADALRAEGGWALKRAHMNDGSKSDMSAECGGAKKPARLARNTLTTFTEMATNSLDKACISFGHDSDACLFISIGTADTVAATLGFIRDTVAQPWRAHELDLLSEIADHLTIALKQADMIRRLETLSRIDDLTGLLNRRALFSDIAPRLSHQKRHPRPACFLYIDLDHFKQVNDRLGHAAGDNVLRTLGETLRGTSRAGDLEGRIGGDEFALWLEDTDIDGARQKAERLMKAVPLLRNSAGSEDVPLSMSIGIVQSDPVRWSTPAALADAADRALYKAKRAGRSTIALCGETPDIITYDKRKD